MFSKSLIEFSIDGWGCVPSLLLDLRPNYGGGNEENGDHLPKVPCTHCPLQCPQPCGRPPQTHASARDSGTFMSKSELVSCGSLLLSPGSWCAQGFFCVLQESVSPVLLCSGSSMVGLMETSYKRAGGSEVKASASNAGNPGSIPGSGRSPGEGKWQPTSVLLPGESNGGRSLVGYSPRGRKESDTTERLHFHFQALV